MFCVLIRDAGNVRWLHLQCHYVLSYRMTSGLVVLNGDGSMHTVWTSNNTNDTGIIIGTVQGHVKVNTKKCLDYVENGIIMQYMDTDIRYCASRINKL